MNKTTRILIVAIVVLGGIYVAQMFTSKTSTTENSKPFSEIDTSKVTRIDVNSGKEIEIQRTESRWMIVSPVKFPADPGQISMLLTRIAANPSASVVADNLSDSSAYGLGNGAAFVSLKTSDGKKLSMRIGNVTPDFNGCYLQLAGETKVLQLSTNIRTLVGESLTDWRDKKVFDFGVSDVELANFTLGDTLYRFSHGDSSWQVNGVKVPEMKVRDIIGGLAGTTAIGFVDSSLSPSKVILNYDFTLLNGGRVTGQIFKPANSESYFGEVCISNSADNQIYTISSTVQQSLLQGLHELRKDYLTKESS